MAADLAAAAGAGVLLGIGFNPLASIVGAVIAAALGAVDRTAAAVAVIAVAWALGDGTRLYARVVETLAGSGIVDGVPAAQWLALGLWAAVGIAVGYLLPAWAGAYVGRNVTFGTGWLAAGMVALTASGALSMLSGTFGG